VGSTSPSTPALRSRWTTPRWSPSWSPRGRVADRPTNEPFGAQSSGRGALYLWAHDHRLASLDVVTRTRSSWS